MPKDGGRTRNECFVLYKQPMTTVIERVRIDSTHGEVVDTIRNGLTAKFDAQCVLPGVFDRVVDAKCSIAVILDVNVHVTIFVLQFRIFKNVVPFF